jgi:hypothetical protein
MTAPDQHPPHTQTGAPAQERETANAPMDSPSGQVPSTAATPMQSSAEHAGSTTAATMKSDRHPEPLGAHGTESGADESLFGDLLLGLRSRWDDVQAGFVDDPRQCVQQADRLVSDVVERLTAGFAQARSRLEQQWARGEEASTEDLRQALKRYREFFHRLLSVDDTEAPKPDTTARGSSQGDLESFGDASRIS